MENYGYGYGNVYNYSDPGNSAIEEYYKLKARLYLTDNEKLTLLYNSDFSYQMAENLGINRVTFQELWRNSKK